MRRRVTGVFIEDGKVLLIKRIKEGDEFYVFPGGGVDEEESIEEALLREMKEETNLVVEGYEQLWEFGGTTTEKTDNRHIFYLIREFSGNLELGGPEKERLSEDNFYELQWVEFAEVKNLILYPEEGKKRFTEKFC